MTTATPATRPKAAPPAAETRRASMDAGREQRAPLSGSPRYLRASVRLGGVHDPEEREAEHAAGVVASGGHYQVRDPGGADHLRAATGAHDGEPAPTGPGRVRAAVSPPVADPGAAARVRRMATDTGGAVRPAAAPPVVDPGAEGRVRRSMAPVPQDPGGATHLRAMHGPDAVRGAPVGMPPGLHGAGDAAAGSRIEHARSAVARPLPATVRARLEHGFGESLETVQVHSGPTARAAASAIGARAYTEGERITLGHGESEHDVRLLAHEATHVVQNRRTAGVPRRLPAAEAGPARRETGAAPVGEVRRELRTEAAPHGEVRRELRADTAPHGEVRREPRTDAAPHGEVRREPRAEAAPTPAATLPAATGTIRRLGLDTVLDAFADLANMIPGFRLFTIILGLNPINMSHVDRSGANILRGAVEIIPLGGLIVKALDSYGVFDRAGAWVDQQIASLQMTGAAIRDALMEFLDSLGLSDIVHPGDVWDRAKRIFTEPIERIKAFFVALAEGIVAFVKDAVLRPLAELASKTRAWDLLIALLGKNPITGEAVPQTAETLIGGFMKLIGQEEIWQNLKKANAIARAFAWFQQAKAGLLAFASQLPSLFLNTLKSLVISDLLDLPGTFARIAGVFGDFAGRFFTWAGNAVWNLLEIIFDVVSPGALAYIKKTGAALKRILKNPLPFVGNLVKAAKLGLQHFADNFGEHLKAGLIDWLTGSLPGVYIPKALSLSELGKFALSVLGITWAQIRAKIVKALGPSGEKIMTGLETAFDVVVALVSGGPAAAWALIKEKLTNLKDMVIEGILGFVVDSIVKKAIPKLISMFIPGAGFISAILSIYDTVMVFVQKLSKIAAAVMAFVDSIVAIAAGQIEGAAKRVEAALAGLLSLAISFLAGFLGLGNVAEKILGVIKKVQAFVDKALDTAITWIVGKAKALFGKLFGGGKKDERTPEEKQRDLDKAGRELRPQLDALLATNPSEAQLNKQLRSWQRQYRLTELRLEGTHIIAKINPELTLSDAEHRAVGLALEPILARVEQTYLSIVKGPEESEDLAPAPHGYSEEAAWAAMAEGSRPSPNATAQDVMTIRDRREHPETTPTREMMQSGQYVEYYRNRANVAQYFVPPLTAGEAAYENMQVPSVPVGSLPADQRTVLALEQARSRGNVAAAQVAHGLSDLGIPRIATTADVVQGPLNILAHKGSGRQADEQSFRGRPVRRASKRHAGIGRIFDALRAVLNRPENEIITKPGGKALIDLARDFEAWLQAAFPAQGTPRSDDEIANTTRKLEADLLRFLHERLKK